MNLKSFLHEFGIDIRFSMMIENLRYVVIKDVLNNKEVRDAKTLLWDWLENLDHGIKQRDPSSWNSWPGWKNIGLIPSEGIGQSDFVWYNVSIS